MDFLIDDHTAMSVRPIKVKSGKDYTIHSALNNLLKSPDYHILAGTVLSNEREIHHEGNITYRPVYFVMFMEVDQPPASESAYIF